MPASEEEVKKKILKEMFGNMISIHVDGHKTKDSLDSIKINQLGESNISVIDNRENYEINLDVAHTKDCSQMHSLKADWEISLEDNSNRISEMEQQNPNDIKNSKIQKGFCCSDINTFNNRIIKEKNLSSFTRNDDDLTFVKEAYAYQDISSLDMDCNVSSVSSSFVKCQDEVLDNRTVSDKPKAYLAPLGIYIQEQRSSDSVQTSIQDGDTKLDMLKDGGEDETKYMTDIMQSEKDNTCDEDSKDSGADTVKEKQDVEKAEKCQMAYAEQQTLFNMLYSEVLSESIPMPLSFHTISLPISSSFLSLTRPVYVEHKMYKTYSFESASLSEENRLSQEWPARGNFCYPYNIIASRQTNIPSFLISDEIFSLTADLHNQHEKIIFHGDNKTCNLNSFSGLVDWNVFKISISTKCESKDVFEKENWNRGRYENSESRCHYQGILEKEFIEDELDSLDNMSLYGINTWKEFPSNFEECSRYSEYLKNNKDLEKQKVDDCSGDLIELNSIYSSKQIPDGEYSLCEDMRESEDSFNQSEIVNMPADDDFRKEESVDVGTVYLFNTLGGKTENGFGKIESQENSSDDFQEEGEKKNKFQKLRKPAIRKSKGKKQLAHRCDNKRCSFFPNQSRSFNSKVRGFHVKPSQRTENEPSKCDRYQSRQDQKCKKCHWINKYFQPLFSIVKSTSPRKKNDGQRKNVNRKKEFARKSRNKMPKLFQYKINQSKGQGTKIKERNGKNYLWQKPTNTRKFGDKLAQFFQKPNAFIKWQGTWQMRLFKGYILYLIGDPPIRLHLVEARVHTRSGGGQRNNGNYSSSGAGSSNGNQGNGNNSSQRGDGSGRRSGSGSSSGGSGNNDDHNKKNTPQKSSTSPKRSKNKNTENKTDSTDNNNSSPSLPPPRLDPSHKANRNLVERTRQFYEPEMHPSMTALASNQQEGSHDSPEGVPDAQNSLCEEEEEDAPSFQHAAISIEQLCDILGNSTRSCPSGLDTFASLNICLSRMIHDLSLAANNNEGASFDNCSACLVLSQLLIHMADPGHDGCVRSCEQCSQIFNLIMEHCVGCIANGRQKSRVTQSDLCYKICKYSQWNIDRLCQSSNKLKGKVQKYCDKVLGNAVDMTPVNSSTGVDSEAIGEIGEAMIPDVPSTGVSSSATLSLGGNIVTVETGEPEQRPTHVDYPYQIVNLPFSNTFGPSLVSGGGAAAICSSGVDSEGHLKLVRKQSQPRKTPAIPQPIPEDSQPESNTTTSPDGADERTDDTENIIIRRMMRNYDPYETLKTYGTQHQYGSLQEGNVHDVEQFLSVSTQPLGAPGIGEVVFGHPPQLKIVAGFWDRRRQECERTQICPYQHREEGVILAEYKEYFGILLTRYQKHHQWERVSHLGNGMSGKCHLAIDLKTNFKFCCKKIHLLRYAEEELTLWSEMKNPYVVRLYGAIRHGVKIYIFSEFIDGGSLAACIEEQKYLGRRLSHWSAINYFQQLLKVLAFLQKKNILHEDIKADNILLRRNSTYLAVTDFGTSRRLHDPKELKNKSPLGSPTHWSPEKASMEGHGFPSDLWAAVCVLVHMLSGEPPWVKRFMHKAAILNFIIFARSPPMEDVPGNVQLIVRDLIEKGFIKDPQARPSSSELLQHPAFKILDEGTPETYFSTLTSMAHGLPFIQAAAGGVEQQNVRKEVPMFSAAYSTPPASTILFETKVGTGPYQESDNRPGNKDKQPSDRMPEVINPNDNVRTVDQQQNEADRNATNVVDQSEIDNAVGRDGGQAASAETQNEKLHSVPHIPSYMATENQASTVGGNVDSKVRQLVGPLDIESLLPQFNELFVSGESQSIKSFFADAYSTQEFIGVRQPPLEMYKPEVKTDALPNLSIFDWEASPAPVLQDVTPERENLISNLFHIDALPGVTNPPIRGSLLGRQGSTQNATNFMLSSESDDCTSADLFEPEPAARSSDSGQHASNSDIQAETSGSETQMPIMYPVEDMNPTASTGSSSNTSALQMRKPTNLTLYCTPLPPELPHSQSDNPLVPAQPASETGMKHRSNTWSQLSSSGHNPLHTGSASNSSQASSNLKRTNGTSVPSTASSGHSQFSYHRSSVKEEQEKRIQELTTDMLSAYSPTSSDSDTSFFVEYHQDAKCNDVPEYEDIDTLLRTMREEMDETKLGGHDLKFFDDDNRYLFTMHIEEFPANWRHLITSFRHRITHSGYTHFSVTHMNNKPVKYHHPLGAHEFRVTHIKDPGEQCWCHNCKPMY